MKIERQDDAKTTLASAEAAAPVVGGVRRGGRPTAVLCSPGALLPTSPPDALLQHRRPEPAGKPLHPTPLSRWDLDEILALIDQKKYFLLHAPRQTGKTTCLLALMEHLNREGRYRAVYANLEGAQARRERIANAMATIVTDIANSAQVWIGDDERPSHAREVLATTPPGSALNVFLRQWCQQTPQPLVLLLDEVDALIGDTLLSLLRQLRAGYSQRPTAA